MHPHAAFADLPADSRPIELPHAEAWAAEELSLPMFAELSEAEVDRVIEACHTACKSLPASLSGVPAGDTVRLETVEEVHHSVDDIGETLG